MPHDFLTPPPPPSATGSGPRGFPSVVVWVAIALLAVAWVALSSLRSGEEPEEGAAVAPERISAQSELVGELTYAIAGAAKGEVGPDLILRNAEPLAEAPSWLDRLAWAILVAAVKDPPAGLVALERVEPPADSPHPAEDRALLAAVREAMPHLADPDAAAPVADESLDRLGWYGRLLRQEVEPRPGLVVALLGYGAWFLVAFLGGVAVIVTLVVIAAVGRLRSRLGPPSAAGRIYGETFAVWMGLFLALNLVGGLAVGSLLGDEPSESAETAAGLAIGLFGFFGSLAALAWPAVRGLRWSTVREDLGLHAGGGLVRETLAGLLTYWLALPLLAVGLVFWAILNALAGPQEPPSHPAVEMIGGAGWPRLLGLFLLASVAAPLVEEIFFRGVLYRHLREVSRGAGVVASVAISAVASSILFAAIHPQGLLFVPVLAALAIAFCIARELRGSLVPAIVAHGVNNAVTLSLGVTLLGG